MNTATLMRRLRSRGVSLAALFANGEKGAWYDPSDLSTLWQDSARTTPVTDYGDPVGAMDDKSGNDNHATQAVAAARPIYGRVPATGRRNLLKHSEDFSTGWQQVNVTLTQVDGAEWQMEDDATGSEHSLHRGSNFIFPAGELRVASWELKAGTHSHVRIGMRRSSSMQVLNSAIIDLSDGSVVDTKDASATTTDIGDGWYRVVVTAAATGNDSRRGFGLQMVPPDLTDAGAVLSSQYAGTGDTIFIRKPQAEVGTSATDYQRVGSEYDVSEDGVRSLTYLYADSDDELECTLPDLGTDATVAYASDQGVTIQTGQTIGAGAFDVLRDDMLFGMVVIDRALSAVETARLTAWLEARAGEYA